MAEEGKNIKFFYEPPVIARAFKLFMQNEYGGRIPLLCHVQGFTSDVLLARTKQVAFAMKELIRVGKIYFPTLDTLSDEFKNFRRVVNSSAKYMNIVTMMHAFNVWRRDSIVQGCLDMIAIGKVDDLRVM